MSRARRRAPLPLDLSIACQPEGARPQPPARPTADRWRRKAPATGTPSDPPPPPDGQLENERPFFASGRRLAQAKPPSPAGNHRRPLEPVGRRAEPSGSIPDWRPSLKMLSLGRVAPQRPHSRALRPAGWAQELGRGLLTYWWPARSSSELQPGGGAGLPDSAFESHHHRAAPLQPARAPAGIPAPGGDAPRARPEARISPPNLPCRARPRRSAAKELARASHSSVTDRLSPKPAGRGDLGRAHIPHISPERSAQASERGQAASRQPLS